MYLGLEISNSLHQAHLCCKMINSYLFIYFFDLFRSFLIFNDEI